MSEPMNSIQRISRQEELEIALAIRIVVFVTEQGVPLEDELDPYDVLNGSCEHILAYYEGQPAGTARIRVLDGIGKLERICVTADYRKFGIGKQLVLALEEIALEKGCRKVKLHGQSQAQAFYSKLGYQNSSDEFIEDGIPHLLMIKELAAIK